MACNEWDEATVLGEERTSFESANHRRHPSDPSESCLASAAKARRSLDWVLQTERFGFVASGGLRSLRLSGTSG
jgi:hypothetical protein